ncbi:MAG: ribosome small subunit-dependent GTPase A [Thermoanaerobaculia bacterium]|nr:ribosome small subunit-dependent GTPase A [Thermoanaerobaculia bacterium]
MAKVPDRLRDLAELGWDDDFATALQALHDTALVPGRVVAQLGPWERVATAAGEVAARTPGGVRHRATSALELPTIGDWVALRLSTVPGEPARLEAVLARRSAFVRRAAGERDELQVVAANIDIVLLAAGLDGDFNPRRLDRYLTLAWESGAQPVVLLTKADLAVDLESSLAAVRAAAPGVPVLAISVVDGRGLEELAAFFRPGRTVAFLGSSGVGKSTLLNRLLGTETQRVSAVRASDRRGRHTTTRRELFTLPGGALAIDTPGMRELQLWESDSGLEATFEDLEALAADCRFRDCGHSNEPGCAVTAALVAGTLAPERLASWRKLEAEQQQLEVRRDAQARLAEKAADKVQHKALRQLYQKRGRR